MCESMTREQYGYRSPCSRTATKMIFGHWLCSQHATRALRRRVIHLTNGDWFKVPKS